MPTLLNKIQDAALAYCSTLGDIPKWALHDPNNFVVVLSPSGNSSIRASLRHLVEAQHQFGSHVFGNNETEALGHLFAKMVAALDQNEQNRLIPLFLTRDMTTLNLHKLREAARARGDMESVELIASALGGNGVALSKLRVAEELSLSSGFHHFL